ncbi:MAG TPA: M90 family metallopeptidase [Mucilaginibacter sp.]|jgi:Mlc titration factor MtfA (ptsG expression regulator)
MYIILLVILVALGAYFLWQKRTKAKVAPTENYRALLEAHVAFYQRLDAAGKIRFEAMVNTFLQDTRIEGVGTEITPLDRALIAASAVIPIFGFPGWRYKNLTNVILYPDTFDEEFQFEGGSRHILGMVGSGYMNGQMLLSRAALTKGFSKEHGTENTAIHEFVHLLDMSDGAINGIPENLLAHEYVIPWLRLMHREMRRIETGQSDINPYALTNEAEFFAVAAEYFFEKPEQLQEMHPEVYELLGRVFGKGG